MKPMFLRYAPKSPKEVVGQDAAISELKKFIVNYKKNSKKAAFIYGPSGNGKTCSVYALANDLGLEILEVNASDTRNEAEINAKLGMASKQMSLFSKGKLILIDEIDGVHGREDRGGLKAVMNVMDETGFPIIITANNPWDNKFSSLRKKSVLIEFKELGYMDIFSILKDICKKEKIGHDETALKSLARRSAGDCRAAINDLECLMNLKKDVDMQSLDELGFREKEDTIINALLKIFKTTDPKIAITAFDNVKEDFNQRFLWIDENLPKEYEKPEDLAAAYDFFSKADVFNGRIRRWQHWRFLVYINALISAGIAVSKEKKYDKFVKYSPTGRLLSIFWANQKAMKKKAIAEKLAEATHCSSKEAVKNVEFLRPIFRKNKDMAEAISKELDLDHEQIAWLKKP